MRSICTALIGISIGLLIAPSYNPLSAQSAIPLDQPLRIVRRPSTSARNTITTLRNDSIAFTEATTAEESKPAEPPSAASWFSRFAGALSAGGNKANVALELAATLLDYRFVRNVKWTMVVDTLSNHTIKKDSVLENRYYPRFVVLGRAIATADSVERVAAQYVTSLAGSPFTFRFTDKYRLAGAKQIRNEIVIPQTFFSWTADVRAVPIATPNGGIRYGIGTVGSATLSRKTLGRRSDEDSVTASAYAELTALFAFLNRETATAVTSEDGKPNDSVYSAELRAGLESRTHPQDNFGVLLRYVISKHVRTPRFAFGVSYAPPGR